MVQLARNLRAVGPRNPRQAEILIEHHDVGHPAAVGAQREVHKLLLLGHRRAERVRLRVGAHLGEDRLEQHLQRLRVVEPEAVRDAVANLQRELVFGRRVRGGAAPCVRALRLALWPDQRHLGRRLVESLERRDVARLGDSRRQLHVEHGVDALHLRVDVGGEPRHAARRLCRRRDVVQAQPVAHVVHHRVVALAAHLEDGLAFLGREGTHVLPVLVVERHVELDGGVGARLLQAGACGEARVGPLVLERVRLGLLEDEPQDGRVKVQDLTPRYLILDMRRVGAEHAAEEQAHVGRRRRRPVGAVLQLQEELAQLSPLDRLLEDELHLGEVVEQRRDKHLVRLPHADRLLDGAQPVGHLLNQVARLRRLVLQHVVEPRVGAA
mmetsp:Transcript_72469/g.192722  ORF Transcript_72469/g.192722 Transcript_72469/m.192722 type:complete len:382 (-) Transcript_72469:343-1488(-)